MNGWQAAWILLIGVNLGFVVVRWGESTENIYGWPNVIGLGLAAFLLWGSGVFG